MYSKMKTINKQTIMKALRRLTWTSRVNGDVYARFCERPVVKPRRAYSAIFIAIQLTLVLFCFACTKARIEPDYSVYGDKAFVNSINTFYYKEVKSNLNYGEQVTGYQKLTITNTQTIDKDARKINIVLAKIAGVDLSNIGIAINTDAQRVEPVNGAPTAGLIGDFSKGPYIYRLFSADGTTRDWTLTFSIAP
jgi:hypothetical protein